MVSGSDALLSSDESVEKSFTAANLIDTTNAAYPRQMNEDRPSSRLSWREAFVESSTGRVLLGAVGSTGHAESSPGIARALRDEGYEVIVLGLGQTYAGLVHAAIDEDVDLVVAIDDELGNGSDNVARPVTEGVNVLIVPSDIDTASLLSQAAGRRRQM